ncbi:MAG TPA: 4Fe-4S dicluster domain-containing protein [Proteobacteria bacterium]|nr:4Fe-4S dicluster domain-containing protein [Pseudomonadota bacterium]
MDVYRLLAGHLDNLPAGFPATASGVELRILRRLFAPEEAAIALGLRMMPEPAARIARRLGADENEVAAKLETMAGKGLIFRSRKDELVLYMASQFVVGIWEYHVNDLNADLIHDVNEYLPYLMEKTWSAMETKQLRVIPVAESVNPEAAVMPYEEAERIIRSQSKIVVAPCICRREQKMVGAGCDSPMEACFSFGAAAFYYEENGLGRAVSQEEALVLMGKGLDAGLVLQPSNSQKPINICMCCGCCCQVLKNIKKMPQPARMVSSNYYAEVDAERCVACGACAEHCHMEALHIEAQAVVDPERCIGCGVCVPVCSFEALRLRRKEPEKQIVPPETMVQTFMQMARERGKL